MTTTNPATDREVYEQYPALLDQLVAFVRPLMLLPLSQMAAANERMQTLAPFLVSPLAYHGGAQNLTDQRRLIEAAAALQAVVRSFKPEPEAGGRDG